MSFHVAWQSIVLRTLWLLLQHAGASPGPGLLSFWAGCRPRPAGLGAGPGLLGRELCHVWAMHV
eukprot:266801-Chlamydomonas_euryale.AAC.5